MRIAHAVTLSRAACGKFQTALEIAAAERKLGVDAALVDPECPHGTGPVGGVPVESMTWAREADVIVGHAGEEAFHGEGIPIICALHGQPASNFITGTPRSGSYALLIERSDAYAGYVTFWPEHLPYYEQMVGKGRINVVPAPVDLNAWTPEGPKYQWAKGKAGPINVVMADRPGPAKSMFHALSAFLVFLDAHPGSKLHVYGQSITTDNQILPLIHLIRKKGGLGELGGWVKPGVLAGVYRAADMVITETKVASRIVREALACGCQVVAGHDNPHTNYHPDVENLTQYAEDMHNALNDVRNSPEVAVEKNRSIAEIDFDPENTAKGMIEACEKAIGSRKHATA